MANTNQYGPRGSLTYNQVGTTRLTLPNGESYELPQWEQRETLSPNQQVLANQQENLGIGLNDLAGDQITRLAGVLGRPVSEDVAGVPQMVSSFAPSGPVQS